MVKNWKEWLRAAGIRALKTVAQTAVATIGTAAVMGEVNWPMVASASVMGEVNWPMVASASVLAGILSLLTSLGGLPELED